ncbi:MAG: NAD(P)H-binding protein [Archangium sp.]
MNNVLILGAHGSIARVAIDELLENTDAKLTLFLRDASRLGHLASDRVRVVEGDVLDLDRLRAVVAGHDLVYANLAGELEREAQNVVAAMREANVRRLVWISSMGIYDEAGEKFGSVLDPYRKSAAIIEASHLDYTVLRPAWLTDDDDIDYLTTGKGEAFIGRTVSRKSVADLIVRLVNSPRLAVRTSLGLGKPAPRRSARYFEQRAA